MCLYLRRAALVSHPAGATETGPVRGSCLLVEERCEDLKRTSAMAAEESAVQQPGQLDMNTRPLRSRAFMRVTVVRWEALVESRHG